MNDFESVMKYYNGNRVAYKKLKDRVQEKNIIPFIGAGLSACCYPTWDMLLKNMLCFVSDTCAQKAQSFISAYDYYAAADTLFNEMGELLFYEAVREVFSEDVITESKIKNEAIYVLPRFHLSTYITTNYDRVIEKAFDFNNIGYEIGFPYDTYKLATYMRNDITQPMILKIHGDIRSNNKDLILTGISYLEHYSDGTELKNQLSMWSKSKNFLFLGASLYKDRTVSLIAEQMQEGMINYAIMGVDCNEIEEVKKRISPLNVLPIFYDKNDHRCLTIVLKQLLFDLGY